MAKNYADEFRKQETLAGRTLQKWPDDWWEYPRTQILPRQREFVYNVDDKFIGIGGAPDSGKTLAVVLKVIRYCVVYPGISIVVIRKHMENAKKTIFGDIKAELLAKESKYPLGYTVSNNASDRSISFINGSTIQFISGIDDSRMQGGNFDVVVLEEATQLDDSVIAMAVRQSGRSATVREGVAYPAQILWSANPGPGYFKREFADKDRDGRPLSPGFRYYRMRTKDNPAADYEFKLAVLSGIHPGDYAFRLLEGLWDFPEGAIYQPMLTATIDRHGQPIPLAERDVITRAEMDEKGWWPKRGETVVAGLDHGVWHPTVIYLAVVRENYLIIFYEFHEPFEHRVEPEQYAMSKCLTACAPATDIECFPDPATKRERERGKISNTDPWTAFVKVGMKMRKVSRDIMDRVNTVRRAIASMRVKFVEGCAPKYEAERGQYVWADNGKPDPDCNDHCMDSHGYLIMGMSGRMGWESLETLSNRDEAEKKARDRTLNLEFDPVADLEREMAAMEERLEIRQRNATRRGLIPRLLTHDQSQFDAPQTTRIERPTPTPEPPVVSTASGQQKGRFWRGEGAE